MIEEKAIEIPVGEVIFELLSYPRQNMLARVTRRGSGLVIEIPEIEEGGRVETSASN